jgi:DNA-binding FadR family transcriptional regulator
MLMVDDAIVRRRLSDEVFDRLMAMITGGALHPGDAMPSERDLMQRFGVGRPAVREAMHALANMGLISISHGERARVHQLTARSILHQVDMTARIMLATSPDSLDHLKAARRFFERGMVREAAERGTEADIERLRATLQRQRESLGDSDAFITADMRFHTQIAAISGNPLFEAVSEAMLNWLRQYHTELLIWTGKENFTLAEHETIIERLAAHDPEGAEEAMTKHLDRSAVLYAHHANGSEAAPKPRRGRVAGPGKAERRRP